MYKTEKGPRSFPGIGYMQAVAQAHEPDEADTHIGESQLILPLEQAAGRRISQASK